MKFFLGVKELRDNPSVTYGASSAQGTPFGCPFRGDKLVTIRTCLHKKYVWIFEHNFVVDKAKICRRAVARQVFFTQYAAKFAEKALVYACEDRF